MARPAGSPREHDGRETLSWRHETPCRERIARKGKHTRPLQDGLKRNPQTGVPTQVGNLASGSAINGIAHRVGNPTPSGVGGGQFREQGLFWVGLGGTAQPDGRWIQIAHVLVEDRNLDFIRTVSLLAQLSAGV